MRLLVDILKKNACSKKLFNNLLATNLTETKLSLQIEKKQRLIQNSQEINQEGTLVKKSCKQHLVLTLGILFVLLLQRNRHISITLLICLPLMTTLLDKCSKPFKESKEKPWGIKFYAFYQLHAKFHLVQSFEGEKMVSMEENNSLMLNQKVLKKTNVWTEVGVFRVSSEKDNFGKWAEAKYRRVTFWAQCIFFPHPLRSRECLFDAGWSCHS